MHVFGAFELDIQPGSPDNPACLRVALLRYTSGARTGACSSLRSAPLSRRVEGQLNSLQDELDEIRERARRAFQIA